jgi:uncharacterized protein GlcG (DUF336 family)
MSNRLFLRSAAIAFLCAASSLSVLPQDQGLLTQKAISADMALAMVRGALEKCRADNYRVSVHVLDVDGQVKASVRDDGSSEVNYEVSRRKAYTALTYKRPSSEMEKAMANMSAGRIIPDTFMVGGGVPVKVGNDTIGAIGVGGAPGSDKDEACAAAGLAKIADKLK